MTQYEFKRSNRKCSVTGRDFAAGEEFISALIRTQDDLERIDFSVAEWQEPPEGCLAWWRSQVPDLEQGRVYWAPRHVLLSYFEHLMNQESSRDLLYVTALLLTRKRHLRLLDTIERDGVEMMVLLDPAQKQKYEVAVVNLSDQRRSEIQDELSSKLFTDQRMIDDEAEPANE